METSESSGSMQLGVIKCPNKIHALNDAVDADETDAAYAQNFSALVYTFASFFLCIGAVCLHSLLFRHGCITHGISQAL